ncbi:t-complex-associated-testis-expressed 1/ dynein light chain [Holotrichia oblita]|uniref:T-complex-associated-testis-expressed 1/ dynein light chain n=2 Tax=Holotrichia oblita TaxID=644536 RepID=A0ACB9TD18_HOLOL|nr:t-complex-associated-testis-expressed 1/ dynein light chain [Holotrichia oblita]KAI4464714.1 t-complex-associated-testis-expressed 1/ dynein light chain [Holotrichia oblita]
MDDEDEDMPVEDKDAIKVDDSVSVMARDPTETITGTAETVSPKLSTESLHPINTYQIKPALANKFKADPVKDLIHGVLTDTLTGQVYDSKNAKKWTVNIANKINEKIKSLQMKRYKHVVQVTLGEMKGAGVKSGVRCLWDAETDGYASDIFINDTIFSVVVVFAIYLY